MTNSDKLQKCYDMLITMYRAETGEEYTGQTPDYLLWVKHNRDRLEVVIDGIMQEDEQDG